MSHQPHSPHKVEVVASKTKQNSPVPSTSAAAAHMPYTVEVVASAVPKPSDAAAYVINFAKELAESVVLPADVISYENERCIENTDAVLAGNVVMTESNVQIENVTETNVANDEEEFQVRLIYVM